MSAKILIISGSDRVGSFNTQLAEQLATAAKAQGFDAEVYDYSQIPLLSQNEEFPTPATITQLRADIEQAQGILIVSPEYNGSYPARLKNLIDWASRAVTLGDRQTPTVLTGKKVAIASVAHSSRGKFVRENLRALIPYVRANLMDGEGLGIQIPSDSLDTGQLILDEEQQEKANSFLADFLTFIQEH